MSKADLINQRYGHWKKLFPEKPYFEYALWIRKVKRRAVDQDRGDVVQVMTFGDIVIANHDNFTAFILEQEN